MLKRALCVTAVAALVAGCASAPRTTQVGPGLYMITGQNATVFGSYHSKVAELMEAANAHCAESGTGATLVETSGRESRAGNPAGLFPTAGQTASASVIYRCE